MNLPSLRYSKIYLFLFIFILVLTSDYSSKADDIYQIIVKKQEEKKINRWTLDEWLATRERMKWMDLWLALHSSTPYEFLLGGDVKFSPGPYDQSLNYRGNFAAYASIVGLGLEYEADPQKWNALFLFRVFGFHAQATNITLQVGIRNQTQPSSTFRSAVAGLSTTIYLKKVFGLEGVYRHLFPATIGNGDLTYQGNQYEGNLFIDFTYIRVYGGYYNSSEDSNQTGGYYLGTRFFF